MLDEPKNFIETNIIGTFNLLEALRFLNKKRISPKLIHISTDEVYGSFKSGSAKEDTRLDPSSPYAASKASADMLINAYKISS